MRRNYIGFKKSALTPLTNRAYFLYFDRKATRTRARLHVCCTSCSSKLNAWVDCKRRSTSLVVSMVWREPTNHLTNCYFCVMPPIQKGVPRRRQVHWSTQMYLRSFVQCLTVKVCLFQNSRQILPRLWWGRGKYTRRNVYFNMSGIFRERNLCWTTQDHTERTLCSGNSVQATSEKAPRLVRISSLLCWTSIQQCNQIFLTQSQIPWFEC